MNESQKIEEFWDNAFKGVAPMKLTHEDVKMGEPFESWIGEYGPSAQKIVDFGCGEGSLLLDAAFICPTSVCLGLDASRNAIAFAEGSAKKSGLKNISFKVGRIEALRSLPSESVGLFICSNFLDVIPLENVLEYVLEIERLLEKDGHLILKVNFLIDEGIRKRIGGVINEKGEIRIGGVFRSNNRPDEAWIKAFKGLSFMKRADFRRLPKGPYDRLFLFRK